MFDKIKSFYFQIHNALDLVYAELLPEEKLIIIEELKKDGLTAMVGDGINDAPSLAASDIGISMGISGSSLAIETGHMILMSNDIGKIPGAVILARRGQRKVIENVIISVLMKGVILALAFVGYPLVWAAVLADTGTCLVVILNSMLLLRENHGDKPGQEHCRRSPFTIAQNPNADEISLGQSQSNCCGGENSSSSLVIEDSCYIPQAQVLGSQRHRACCKSGKCSLEQKGLQEKVTCEICCCMTKQHETKLVECKSRNCCSENRCGEKENSSKCIVSSGEPIGMSDASMNEVLHRENNQNIRLTRNAMSICSGSKSAKSVITGCCSRGRCSIAKGNVDAPLQDMEQCGPIMIDPNIPSSVMAPKIFSNSESAISVEAGCCFREKCSMTNGTATTATQHLEGSNLGAAESVVRVTEPIQSGKDIKSSIIHGENIVLLKSNQIGGCCKKSSRKESCGGSA